jgi:1,4-dihydroxy-2-naphthoate octaprenyltransferase
VSSAKWFMETRPQFLLLSVVLVAHGAMLALWQGSFSWARMLLAAVALLLMHASVNVLNDWHDYSRTGIDKRTRRTPFSGGSGLLPAGVMTAKGALVLGAGTLLVACAIGLYLAWISGWPLLAIGILGALSVVAYTPVLTRIGLGEVAAGLALGTLPVVGAYYLFTGRLDAVAWVSGIPAGLLTYNLLLLNEFPDAEADATGGRRHMVILLGKRGASWLYAAVEAGVYVAVIAGVAVGMLTPWALLSLGGAIFAAKAIQGALQHYDSHEALIPAQGANVAAVLVTNALLAIGYLIAALTG